MKITVQKSKHPNWKWEVYCPKKYFGRKIQKGFNTESEAKKHKSKLLEDFQDQEGVALPEDIKLVVKRFADKLTAEEFEQALVAKAENVKMADHTLSEIGELYLQEMNRLCKRNAVTPGRVTDIKYALSRLAKLLEDPKLRDVDKDMVEAFVDAQLDLDYSPRYVKNHVDYLSGLMNWAVKEGHILKNTTLEVHLGNYKPPVHILKPSELKQLLKHATHYTRAWIMLGAFGGLRSAEIKLIKWDHIRLDENQFYCPGKKNVGAERWVTMTPPLRAYFEEMLTPAANAPEGWRRKGYIMKNAHSVTIQRWLEKLYCEADQRIPRNALRHSYGSHHLVGFGNQFTTAAEMGHATPETTYAYYRAAVTKAQADRYWKINSANNSAEELALQAA